MTFYKLFLVLSAVLLFSGCASKSIWQPSDSLQSVDLNQETHYNSYPFDVSVGDIDSSIFDSVDVENNFFMTIDMTRFGSNVSKHIINDLSNSEIFTNVKNGAGAISVEGTIKSLKAINSFSLAGTLVTGELQGRVLSHKGGEVIWETTIKHEILTKRKDSNLRFGETISNSFNKLAPILARKFVNELGGSVQLANLIESRLSVNVTTLAEKAEARRSVANKAEAKRIAAEKEAAEKRAVAEKEATEKEVAERIAAEERAATEDAVTEKAIAEGLIDVIGLVPGVSTQSQVERAKADYGYVIGGYRLFCSPEYIRGKLSSFICLTGGEYGSKDVVSGSNHKASNIEVHETLLNGFTKKIGKPKLSEMPTRTKIGTTYTVQVALWQDKKGNELSLVSMTNNIETGALYLKSLEQIKTDKETEVRNNRERNF